MSDYQYSQKMGLVDENGNLTQEGKINRVLAVCGRFHFNRFQVEDALKLYDWDMEAALDWLAMGNYSLREYMYKHPDQVQMLLYSAPSESAAKFYTEHEGAIKAAGKVADGINYIMPTIVMAGFIMLLAAFGL